VLEIARELAIRTIEETENFADEQPDGYDDGEAARTRASAKTIETDQMREALKLVLLLIAAVYRDALIVGSAADAALRALPSELTPVDRLAREIDADQLAERIEAIAIAERMLDRNVTPQLACERLAVALGGGLPA
jgi:hypothetical protein